jgi:ferrous iron transport protein B
MGFDWKIGTALIAPSRRRKFVAQMGIIYAATDGQGGAAQRSPRPLGPRLSAARGLGDHAFCLIGTPCMTTVAVTRRETGSWRWPLLQFGGLTMLAYGITVAVFQTGRILGWGI